MSSKQKTRASILSLFTRYRTIILLGSIGVLFVLFFWIFSFENLYSNKIYPNVYIGDVSVGGMTPDMVYDMWEEKNAPYERLSIEFWAEDTVATVSGQEINLGYNVKLLSDQAFLIGRSRHVLSNLFTRYFAPSIRLEPTLTYNRDALEATLHTLSLYVDEEPKDALFDFENGKVVAFRLSSEGKYLDVPRTLDMFTETIDTLEQGTSSLSLSTIITPVSPRVSTSDINDYGIQELLGTGYSEFQGSIPGRIHNVSLAASRLNGVLVKPGSTFSFNQTVGDISAATGYKSAYIIQNGRTVLGDGGGVCQVSTTLFRAALNAGLKITQRSPHSYRVSYYEQAGYKPGLDATVYSPSVDLQFVNDTDHHILILSETDTESLSLVFRIYGTHDGRTSEITNHQVWGFAPAPPPLYQDDPTLPPGTLQQVDWAASGAKASFDYVVSKNGSVLFSDTFYSNYQPWRAVFLRGVES